MREFSANANVSATTKVPLFLIIKDYNPRMNFDPVNLSANSTRKRIANSTAKLIVNHIEEVWDFMQEKMTKSQAKQIIVTNCHWKKPSAYKIEDKVFLLTRNIKTEQLSKKLNDKNISSFKIKKLMGSSYQLELSHIMKIHDVFHPNLLWKAANDLLHGQQNILPPPTVVNDKEE